MKQIRNTAVMETLSEDVCEYGIKRVAPDLDKEVSSLYGELNPYGDQGKAKLSFDDAIEAMAIIGKYRAFALAAERLGFRLVSITPITPDAPTMFEEFYQDMRKMAAFQKAGVAYRKGEATYSQLIEAKNALVDDVEESVVRVLQGDEERHVLQNDNKGWEEARLQS